MQKLDQSVPVKTRFGTIEATHEFHSVYLQDRPEGVILTSELSFGREEDGRIHHIDEGRLTRNFTAEETASLGDIINFELIRSKHLELSEAEAEKEAAAAQKHADSLRDEIAETEAKLEKLKARRA